MLRIALALTVTFAALPAFAQETGADIITTNSAPVIADSESAPLRLLRDDGWMLDNVSATAATLEADLLITPGETVENHAAYSGKRFTPPRPTYRERQDEVSPWRPDRIAAAILYNQAEENARKASGSYTDYVTGLAYERIRDGK